MRHYLAVVVAIGVVLSGCLVSTSPGSGDQDQPVNLALANTANETHTFEVVVAETVLLDDEVVIHKRSGALDYASPGEGLSSYKLDDDYGYVTSIEVAENISRLYGQYTLGPGERNISLITDFPKDGTVVVVIYHRNRVVSLVAAHCNGVLEYVEVAIRYYGSDNAIICEAQWW